MSLTARRSPDDKQLHKLARFVYREIFSEQYAIIVRQQKRRNTFQAILQIKYTAESGQSIVRAAIEQNEVKLLNNPDMRALNASKFVHHFVVVIFYFRSELRE